MVEAARITQVRRPLAIALIGLAALMVVLVGLALWNPWRLTSLYPLAQQGSATALLVLAGALLATLAVLRFATNGQAAVVALIACIVAVPALCVGLPAVAFSGAFRVATATTLRTSPGEAYAIVKESSPDAVGIRLLVRSRKFLLSREAERPVAECRFDLFERGVPIETVRFTSETTVALPTADQSTVVVRFDPDTLAPERTVVMC